MLNRYFAQELLKIAMSGVPPVTLSAEGISARSGTSGRVGKTETPAVKPIEGAETAAAKVPTASGKNLGTEVSPRPRTVPNPSYGGSLVR